MAEEQGVQFARFLRAAGLPENLWDSLLDKIERSDTGCAGRLQAVKGVNGVFKVVANWDQDLVAEEDVFILPHAFAATRADLREQLLRSPSQLTTCCRLMQMSEHLEGDAEAVDDVFAGYWSFARASPPDPTAGSRALTVWHLEPAEGLWVRHAEQPNAVVVPLPPAVAAVVGGGDPSAEGAQLGASMLWFTARVPAGEEVTRDHTPGPRSLQRAATLVALLDNPRRWVHPEEYEGLSAAVAAEMQQQAPPGVGQPRPADPPSDTRPVPPEKVVKEIKTVWTDYPLVADGLLRGPFTLVDERSAADIVFTAEPVRDFLSLPSEQMINQFPFESCIIRKDLLPQTLRRFKSVSEAESENPRPSQAADSSEAAEPSTWEPCDGGGDAARLVPFWFPPSYDLATEVQHFITDFREREERGGDSHWVVKLAQGARSADACLAHQLPSLLRYRQAPGGDRVVQKYIFRPLLYDGRKFDLRVCILVRSFKPLAAYLYRDWHVRCANKPYRLDHTSLTDFETHFTVACYEDQVAVRDSQVVVKRGEAEKQLRVQGIDASFFDDRLKDMARDLVTAASFNIGEWPRSRAVYGCDVMMVDAEGTEGGRCPLPQLLEVNFCPDFGYLLKNNPGFVADVFETLFTDAPPPPNMIPLF